MNGIPLICKFTNSTTQHFITTGNKTREETSIFIL
uniref:Uncharacterized protein n=1 Tax=Rhizophora mucronata TaxID=61149 RepID=A0A2P2PLT3_RHIMU